MMKIALFEKVQHYSLGVFKDPRAVDPLIQALKDKNAEVRISAAMSLGNLGDKKAVEPLTADLNDENSVVRDKAAQSLKELGYAA